MKRTTHTLVAAGFCVMAGSAFASQNCGDYTAGANKAIAKYIATVGTGTYKDLYFDRKGNFTLDKEEAQSVHIDFVIKSYKLPADAIKKVYYRFTDATTKGVRTGTGRLVCSFRGEYSDGITTGSDVRNFDVDATSDTSNVSMIYSPNEPRGGTKFSAGAIAQWAINSAISKVIVTDPEYQAQMAKLR
jgi:hypothetical protein